MKRALILICCAISANASAQSPAHAWLLQAENVADGLSVEQRGRIEQQLASNRAQLEQRGILSHATLAQTVVAGLQWPLQATPAFIGIDYHGVSNFVDHGPPFPGFVQDYTCGTRTYNVQGYNHAGTDYFIWPFAWLMMDQEQVAVVAAAPGVIVGKSDGNFDRDCALSNSAQWNAVYVQHADDSVAWYGHMKSGTLTSKPIGATVAVGEFLGYVGSSGSSTGPHMHFELHDANGNIVDPRHGQCSAGPDLWAVFQPYEDPRIDSLSTHSAEPAFVGCGTDASGNAQEETPYYKDAFQPGDVLWVFASYHDQRNGEITNFNILRPDGSSFAQWNFDMAGEDESNPFYSGTAWDWSYTLPADAPSGIWKVTAAFQGQTSAHSFSVGDTIFQSDSAAARAQVGAQAARCRPQAGHAAPVCLP